MSEPPSRLHCLNSDQWTEIPDRTIGSTGNCYVGRDYAPKNGKERFKIVVFVKKIKSEEEQ